MLAVLILVGAPAVLAQSPAAKAPAKSPASGTPKAADPLEPSSRSGSKSESPPPSPDSQGKQKDTRYIGSSADWLKLRRDLEGVSENSFERARHLEARQLATHPAGVRRDGKTLILIARNRIGTHPDPKPAARILEFANRK
ncbi:MAG: hypothetical protein NTW21_27050 [Verrucomicrobia bacterium]|nr:hypothetical protein [Verrucomicrobiota bacterium]